MGWVGLAADVSWPDFARMEAPQSRYGFDFKRSRQLWGGLTQDQGATAQNWLKPVDGLFWLLFVY